MWQPYLDVIRQKCSQSLHILDRFHIVAKMNKALDEVRAAESRQMAREGHEPLLKRSPWCVLKRKSHLAAEPPSARVAPLQPPDRPCLSLERRFSAVLEIQLAHLGRQLPEFLVLSNHALPHRAHEENRTYPSLSSPTATQLLQGQDSSPLVSSKDSTTKPK